MDMSTADLLKQKLNQNIMFTQCGHDSDWNEPLITNKGYHYLSGCIENMENLGIRNVTDLFIDKLKPIFLHIISTIYHEAEMEINSIVTTVTVMDYETADEIDVAKYEFTSPPDGAITNYSRSWVYPVSDRSINNKFSIYIETYVYFVDDYIRRLNDAYDTYNPDDYNDEELILFPQMITEESKPLDPPIETYKEEYRVVCLEAKPNILYLNCMHIVICNLCEQEKRKTQSSGLTCDICRAEISKRVKI